MRHGKLLFGVSGILAVLAMALLLPGAAAASTFKLLHEFTDKDGSNPYASLIFDAAGNLYGTTNSGGAFNGGTVFKLTPNSDGSWTESVLHSFTDSPDGFQPTAGLIFDGAGNLYGTTAYGGAFCSSDSVGCGGVVFKLKPNADGTWTESVLCSFCSLANCADGRLLTHALIFDGAGNLYGTTSGGGSSDRGVAFKLAPQSDGSWKETVIRYFLGASGEYPYAGLNFDVAGNLYGTTSLGGSTLNCSYDGCGVVFKLTQNSDGSWKENVLHTFLDEPAAHPSGPVILDAAGNLYGTTANDHTDDVHLGFGTVFKLAPKSGGGWTFSILHDFQGKPAARPYGGLVLDKAGNLYGTTNACASDGCYGVVFEITP